MKKKTKKVKRVKKPTKEQIEEAMEDMKLEGEKFSDKDFVKEYGPPIPTKIIKVFDLGNGAVAVLRSDEMLTYMNTNLKTPIIL